jgi:hypothetical protein
MGLGVVRVRTPHQRKGRGKRKRKTLRVFGGKREDELRMSNGRMKNEKHSRSEVLHCSFLIVMCD